MQTFTFEIALDVDDDAWAEFDTFGNGNPPDVGTIADWLVEVLSTSQGASAGAVTTRRVDPMLPTPAQDETPLFGAGSFLPLPDRDGRGL